MDRQVKAVAELCPFCDTDMAVKHGRIVCRNNWDGGKCKMNIAASGASLVPGLVMALESAKVGAPWDVVENIDRVLSKLPPEYCNETKEQDDE